MLAHQIERGLIDSPPATKVSDKELKRKDAKIFHANNKMFSFILPYGRRAIFKRDQEYSHLEGVKQIDNKKACTSHLNV